MQTIPNIAHCFWYAPDGLPYLRYLSIASFAILNPEIRLKVYTLKENINTGGAFSSHEQSIVHITKDYFLELAGLHNVDIIVLDRDYLDELKFDIDTAVHYSDILRIKLLATEGGYWIDSDIIFTRSLANSYLGYQELSNINTIISHTSLGSVCAYLSHRIGFLAASKSNSFFIRLWNDLLLENDSTRDYQAYGAALYNKIYSTKSVINELNPILNIHNLPNSAFYSLQLTELLSDRIPLELFIESPFVVGCHWYGGGDHLHGLISKFNQALNIEGLIEALEMKEPSILVKLFALASKISKTIKFC